MAVNEPILIFGGTGFIGGSIARECVARKIPVTVFRRGSSGTQFLDGVSFCVGDLADPKSIDAASRSFRNIIFSAAYYPLVSLSRDEQLKRAKTEVKNFFAAIPNTADVVYVSSISTIGKTDSKDADALSDESSPYDLTRNKSLYYQIKWEMEQIALESAAHREGRTVIVNPVAVFGDYDVKPTTSRIVLDAALGRLVFKLEGRTNSADIRDIVNGIFLALERGRSGERYILGGENLRTQDFMNQVCDVVKKPTPKIPMPFFMVRAAAQTSEWIHFLLRRDGAPLIPVVGMDLVENSFFISSAKAEKELGYRHGPVRPGLERAYEWFKNQKRL